MCMYIYIYIYIYYVYRERERFQKIRKKEIDVCMCIYIYIYTYIHIHREREIHTHTYIHHIMYIIYAVSSVCPSGCSSRLENGNALGGRLGHALGAWPIRGLDYNFTNCSFRRKLWFRLRHLARGVKLDVFCLIQCMV